MATPSPGTQRVVRRAVVAAYVAAVSGLVAAVTIGLFFWIGQPWGTVNDLALLVMTAAIAPFMLGFWELGGLTPTPLALAAQAIGWLSVAAWCVVQALMIAGAVKFDYNAGATGAFAVESFALIVIGLWMAGANLLAGPWLNWLRWIGIFVGLEFVVFAYGLLVGGVDNTWTYVGGIGYQIGFPIWAFLMGRHFRRWT